MNDITAFMNLFLRAGKYCQKPWIIASITAICCFCTVVNAQDNKSASKIVATKQGVQRVLYGKASFYSNKFEGRRTASGEIFSQSKLTCACNVLPLGTWLKVSNVRNGHFAIVKVNDRLHPKMKRIVDLTRAAAQKLGFVSSGLARVKVEVLGKNKPR